MMLSVFRIVAFSAVLAHIWVGCGACCAAHELEHEQQVQAQSPSCECKHHHDADPANNANSTTSEDHHTPHQDDHGDRESNCCCDFTIPGGASLFPTAVSFDSHELLPKLDSRVDVSALGKMTSRLLPVKDLPLDEPVPLYAQLEIFLL